MPLLALALVVAVAACGTCLILGARRLRRPRELRGDWWPEFEREFRAYAARGGAGARERQRRRKQT